MVKWVIMKRFSSDHEQIRRFQPGNLHFGGRFLDDHPKLVVILFFVDLLTFFCGHYLNHPLFVILFGGIFFGGRLGLWLHADYILKKDITNFKHHSAHSYGRNFSSR